ncbi:MAG TPA: CBS domain-containing protein [Gemmatimonadales bacterium]|nr:CBS domain-containing protein [Gemmatimonadales bacterium]
MRVLQLMQAPVATIGREASVTEAILTLADRHISALPVVDNRGTMIGVLSTTDILQAESEVADREARDRLFEDTPVEELMTPRPLTISPDADLREAARRMLYGDVHRLFVELNGELIGVISRTDLVRAFAIQRA